MRTRINCLAGDLNVVCVSNDPGGGSAVLPVAREIGERGHNICSYIAGPSVDIFRYKAPELDYEAVDDNILPVIAQSVLKKNGTSILVSASGTYNKMEHTFRVAARALGIPIVAVCDYWYDYSASFGREETGGLVQSLPDIVCVPDEISRAEICKEIGIAPTNVVVTGPPALEDSVCSFHSTSEMNRDKWLRKYDLGKGQTTLVFFSDAFYTGPNGAYEEAAEGRLFDDSGQSIFGYTPPEILEVLVNVLLEESVKFDRKINLLVKPHPREHPEKLMPILDALEDQLVTAKLLTNISAVELMSVADVVFGMGSIVLIESALNGKPTISVQIGLLGQDTFDPCMGNTLGYTIPVFDNAKLKLVISKILDGSIIDVVPKPDNPLLIDGAAARVADVIESVQRTLES